MRASYRIRGVVSRGLVVGVLVVSAVRPASAEPVNEPRPEVPSARAEAEPSNPAIVSRARDAIGLLPSLEETRSLGALRLDAYLLPQDDPLYRIDMTRYLPRAARRRAMAPVPGPFEYDPTFIETTSGAPGWTTLSLRPLTTNGCSAF